MGDRGAKPPLTVTFVTLCSVGALLALLAWYAGCIEREMGRAQVRAELVIEFGRLPPEQPSGGVWEKNGTWCCTVTLNGSATVLYMLLTAAELHGFHVMHRQYTMGTLVTSIAGLENGVEGRYWQYWVNGRYAEMAADRMEVSNGDVIRWAYATF